MWLHIESNLTVGNLKYTNDTLKFLEKQKASTSLLIIAKSSYVDVLDNLKSLSFI